MSAGFCEIAKCRGELETTIDRLGRSRTICPRCDRRRAGLCVDCPRKITGTKSWRCEPCKLERKRHNYRTYHHRNPEKMEAKHRRRWRNLTPEQRERRRARRSELRNEPARREAHNKRNSQWYHTHPIRAFAYQRSYRTTHRAQRREASRKVYRKHHPAPDPHCLECGAAIEWSGKGRPALRCPDHNPWRRSA